MADGGDDNVLSVRLTGGAVKAADLLSAHVAEVGRWLKIGGKLPEIAAVVAVGTTSFEVTTNLLNGKFKKAGGALIAGGAEVAGGFVPWFGVSDVARGAGNKLAKQLLGDGNGGEDAISEQIFDKGTETLAEKFGTKVDKNKIAAQSAPVPTAAPAAAPSVAAAAPAPKPGGVVPAAS